MSAFIVIGLVLGIGSLLVRFVLARRGSGRLAQVSFRREHGETVASLLRGEVDPRPHSPWIMVHVDGRPARLVAARLGGRMQAGIELHERTIPVNVWLTSGDQAELDVPDHVDVDAVLAIVARMRAVEVDSCSTGMPIRHSGGAPHILRMRFDDVAELPDRLDAIAPLLAELEALAPRDPATSDGDAPADR